MSERNMQDSNLIARYKSGDADIIELLDLVSKANKLSPSEVVVKEKE